jgi:hypothetical protein
MNKKIAIVFLWILMAVFSACGQNALPTGNWYGDSVCQVPTSPCKTEKVVYRIIQMNDNGKFIMQADKIINEKPEYMGTIEFQFDEKANTLTAKTTSPNRGDAIWKFTINGKEMEGTLTMVDGTLYRKIKVTKFDCGGKSYDW